MSRRRRLGLQFFKNPLPLKSCWLRLQGFSEVIQAGLPICPNTPANMAGQRGDLRAQRARKFLTSAAPLSYHPDLFNQLFTPRNHLLKISLKPRRGGLRLELAGSRRNCEIMGGWSLLQQTPG